MTEKSWRVGGNPFEFGQAVAPEAIVDREEEIRRLRSAVLNAERVFLIGPRRFGKTSLLNVVQRRLEREGAAVLMYDAEKFESVELLASALMSGALRALSGPIEKIGATASRRIQRFFGALKPEVKYDLVEQSLSVGFGLERRAQRSELPLLMDVLDGINGMAKDAGKPVAVVLDEFQQLVTAGGVAAERQLRAAVQTHRNVSYIFAGSKTRLLTDMTSHHSRPFYRMGAALFLGPVPRAPFADFLRAGFEGRGFKVAPNAVERILDLAEDVPYSVQRLAHRCWDLLNAGGPSISDTLTPRFVEQTLQRIALEDDPAYTHIWVSLTAVQKKALKAVVGRGGTNLLSKSVADEHGLAPASMQKALKALDRRGLIREEQSTGAVRWRLDDPFLATWLRLAQSTSSSAYPARGPGRAR